MHKAVNERTAFQKQIKSVFMRKFYSEWMAKHNEYVNYYRYETLTAFNYGRGRTMLEADVLLRETKCARTEV